jgi:hypothetical protein
MAEPMLVVEFESLGLGVWGISTNANITGTLVKNWKDLYHFELYDEASGDRAFATGENANHVAAREQARQAVRDRIADTIEGE